MKTLKPKTVKKQTIKKAVKTPSKPKKKLSKKDPNYYAKIGAISAAARKLKSSYFSDMAKKSHLPGARDGYYGGRKPKEKPPCQPKNSHQDE
jgi:hypothetical protein